MKLQSICFLASFSLLSFCSLQAKDFSEENFFIKKDYISRNSYTHFDDSCLQDQFQDEVYFAAHQLAISHDYKKIGDIGCGSGFKLLKYFGNCDTLGFELPSTLDFLLRTYPHKNWHISDFSQLPADRDFDVLICSDVIEHLVNPDDLLNWIDQLNFKYLVISTPDRDQLIHVWPDDIYGPKSQSGPPVNIAHVREWSFEEFEHYISQYFDIVDHFDCEKEFYGQVVIAVKKEIPQ